MKEAFRSINKKIRKDTCSYAEYYLSFQCEGKETYKVILDWQTLCMMCFECDLCKAAVIDNDWEKFPDLTRVIHNHKNQLQFIKDNLEEKQKCKYQADLRRTDRYGISEEELKEKQK